MDTYRGIPLTTTSTVDHGVTVKTVSGICQGNSFSFTGCYGNAERAAERHISRLLGITLCPNCGTDTIPEMPICSSCYAGDYGSPRFGGEVPAGVDW